MGGKQQASLGDVFFLQPILTVIPHCGTWPRPGTVDKETLRVVGKESQTTGGSLQDIQSPCCCCWENPCPAEFLFLSSRKEMLTRLRERCWLWAVASLQPWCPRIEALEIPPAVTLYLPACLWFHFFPSSSQTNPWSAEALWPAMYLLWWISQSKLGPHFATAPPWHRLGAPRWTSLLLSWPPIPPPLPLRSLCLPCAPTSMGTFLKEVVQVCKAPKG